MLEESVFLKQRENKRVWFVALSVAVGCCVIFSVMMIYFVTTWGKTLNAIDNRLANLEMRDMDLPSLPPSAAAVPVPSAEEIPAAAPLPVEPVAAVGPAAPVDTMPAAPLPSKDEPPAKASERQMSVPPAAVDDGYLPPPGPHEPLPLP